MILNDYAWLTWGVSRVPHGDLPPDVRARIDADRQRANALPRVVRRIPLDWTHDWSVPERFIDHPYRLRSAWRWSAELTFNKRHVSVEAIGGVGSGPGFAFKDVRIHLDGTLVGRAWSGGCSLGFGGGVGPAVAMVRDDLALRVTLALGIEPGWENLEVLGPRRLRTYACRIHILPSCGVGLGAVRAASRVLKSALAP